jgi:hypothetical protein
MIMKKKEMNIINYFNYERALREYLRVYNKEPKNNGVLEKIINCIFER